MKLRQDPNKESSFSPCNILLLSQIPQQSSLVFQHPREEN